MERRISAAGSIIAFFSFENTYSDDKTCDELSTSTTVVLAFRDLSSSRELGSVKTDWVNQIH